jgi:cellulose synthase/poly-beta-1,6-N-acetylglucosamine synthase-like glycosyltransferase
MQPVDIVIPVYSERSNALEATILACLAQNYPVGTVIVVDDGSPHPVVLPESIASTSQVGLLRLTENKGISAARNHGIACSRTALLACVNSEVLPDPDWLATCADYLERNPQVGACYTRTVPSRPDRILTRWRMHFQEPKVKTCSGPAEFAHGHAVLFRREAIDVVSGYDTRFRRNHEDWDICQRMRAYGWDTHYIAESRCLSIQQDSLRELAAKQLRDCGWFDSDKKSLIRIWIHLTKWTLVRIIRNVLKMRWYFLPVDLAIWICALYIATSQSLHLSNISNRTRTRAKET